MPPNETDEQGEAIEGLDHDEDAAWGDYPIDTMLIRNETRTVHDILRRIRAGSYIMDPEFQRDFIWPEDKQSKLIESVLMRIPLPVFYLAEDAEGRMVVVDGLQRLSTFQRFMDNKLTLRLPDQPELKGKAFKGLSAKLQNRIEDCNLVLYIIDSKVPERARLDIFERVNGGVPLTRQQMRNCLFSGPATRFLKVEADNEVFGLATGGSLSKQTMRDREFVNRYCAFTLLGVEDYRGDMDEFLAESLQKMNSMDPLELETLAHGFRQSMRNNFKVFDKFAFRKHGRFSTNRSVINASLWDVMSTALTGFNEDISLDTCEIIRERFYELMGDERFINSITYGTNDTRQVQTRFSTVREMFRGITDA